MAKVRLTKNELKKQKDALKMFQRYLPTLQLKKQQLQIEIAAVRQKAEGVLAQLRELQQRLQPWVAVYAEEFPDGLQGGSRLEQLVEIRQLLTGTGNIAGVEIPLFEDIHFAVAPYDLFETPPWLDAGIQAVQETISLRVQHQIYQEQKRRLEAELRVTTQRVNLFEKVKIPQTKLNIKRISVYMGDQQTAAVVCGKIAKKKLEQRNASQTADSSMKGAA